MSSTISSKDVEAIGAAYRRIVLTDLYVLAEDVLGYTDIRKQPHREMCDWLMTMVERKGTIRQVKGLMLVPRGCFKTTLGSISLPLLLLAADPNLRILITAHSHEYARQILDEIKFHCEFNEQFKALFGEWRVGAAQWSDEAITIGRRTRALKEPSIDTAGVDRPKTGGHYDIIIADDLHSERNIDTDGLRHRVRRHIQTLYPILEPGGLLLVIGTRWHMADAYSWILRQDAEAAKAGHAAQWKTLIRKAIDDKGELYFPTRLTLEFLDQQRLSMEDKLYSVWYMNEPISDDLKLFPRAWWRFFDGQFGFTDYAYVLNPGPVPVYVTMAIDPAISSRERADFTGITVVGCDAAGAWWVLEARRVKGGPEKVLSAVILLALQYQPQRIIVEEVAFQVLYKDLFIREFQLRGMECPFAEMKTGTMPKKRTRIGTLQPLMKQGKLIFKRGLTDLYSELDAYPESERDRDDLLDSLAMHSEIAVPFDGSLGQAKIADTEKPWGEYLDKMLGNANRGRLDGSWAGLGTPRRRGDWNGPQ